MITGSILLAFYVAGLNGVEIPYRVWITLWLLATIRVVSATALVFLQGKFKKA